MFATGPGTQGKPVWPEDMTYLKYIMSAFYRSVCEDVVQEEPGREDKSKRHRRKTKAGERKHPRDGQAVARLRELH